MAEIHKRIREEKQNSGRVISVAEAKKMLDEEKQTKGAGGTLLNRKSSLVSLKSNKN